MTAADIYLSALNGWKLPQPKQERLAEEGGQEPKRLAGGCLLYRFTGTRKKAQHA